MKNAQRNGSAGSIFRALLPVSFGLAGLLVAGNAMADWKVTDKTTQDKIEETNKLIEKTNERIGTGTGDDSIQGRLKKLYDQQMLDNTKKSEVYKDKPKDEITDLPDFDLVKDTPEGAEGTKIDKDKRCKTGDKICELIFDTERAKYNYSVAVYKNITDKRIKELKEIQEQRNGIADADQGKLQSNTNRLLTLMAKMEIDKQQQKVALDAYDARIGYLQSARDTAADVANNGPKNLSLTDMALDLAAGEAMKIMFDSLETVRN